jgi:hypothetical protein
MTELEKAAGEYMRASGILAREQTRRAEAEAAIKGADEMLRSSSTTLCDSVQPNCGSATKPSRRMYRIGTSPEVLIVEWVDGIERARISIMRAETL